MSSVLFSLYQVYRQRELGRKKGLTRQSLVAFAHQLGQMLKAGFSLVESLDILIQNTSVRHEKRVIGEIKQGLERGIPLSTLLKDYPGKSMLLLSQSVLVSEGNGSLAEALEDWAKSEKRQIKIQEKLKKSIRYPLWLLIMALVMLFLLSHFLLPQFLDFFSLQGTQIPLQTKLMIGLLSGIDRWGALLIFLILVSIGGGYGLGMLYPPVQRGWHKTLLNIPFFGHLWAWIELQRFFSHMGLLCDEGRRPLQALEICSQGIGNEALRQEITRFPKKLLAGETFSTCLKHLGCVPLPITHLLYLSEKRGQLSQGFIQGSCWLEERIDETLENMIASLEPLLLGGIGGLFLWIVLAFFLPLYEQMEGLA